MHGLEKILEEIEGERTDIDDYSDAKGKMLARHWNDCIDGVEEIIRKHINDGWIPVNDRLPEEPPEYVDDEDDLEECIVMIDGAERPTTLKYAGDGTWWEDGTYYHVVAWQPMPDSYTNQIDKKIALAAAQIIKDYCRQQDCKYCIFGDLKFCRMKEGGCPAYWEIK